MAFTETEIETAAAVVRIFETGRPLGDPTACVVLNDRAGITYGTEQFTHGSGSLARVAAKYIELGGRVGAAAIAESLPLLEDVSGKVRSKAVVDTRLRTALRAAGITSEMRRAQSAIAREMYVSPALDEAAARGFVLPLSFAVVYDSFIHGSWEKIASRIDRSVGSHAGEKAWITAYVRERDSWLASQRRLAVTRYRTRFFLNAIAVGRWQLRLPLNVRGVALTDNIIRQALKISMVEDGTKPADIAGRITPGLQLPDPQNTAASGQNLHAVPQPEPSRTPAEILDEIERKVDAAAARYDQTEHIITAAAVRKDSSKSLWTTLLSTVWQPIWAVAAFLGGLPREVWLVVALAVAAFGIFYLYRQLIFGRIRELAANARKI